ncbi:ATP-binding domain-containing protein [Sporosarcina sp. Sa2YVA2]|uniref:ATP-binding domain-containing protein n=1 Tax=Sporosarcina quadrami TaxID=2762234 RepID=A0ABR8UCG6_9BACL|nr:ATP-binding domain-containing protein [Sporosarcina quadrami]MBD7985728.1 ATP-binding domain-containing protein [Sporosarcina quadrami]
MIYIVNGEKRHPAGVASFQKILSQITENYDGTAYYGFALSEIDNKKILVDALLVTKEKGIIAINFASSSVEEDLNDVDRIYLLLRSLLEKNKRLRKRTKLAIDITVVNYVATKDAIPDGYEEDYICEEEFLGFFEDEIDDFNDEYYTALNESLDKVVSAKPKKLRKSVVKASSLGAKIKEIELEIANMDRWQRTAAYEIPDSPQRIRGLAGSGKTIVLALKAAYLHFKDPNADIAITFYSRSLYQQFISLIEEFYQQYSSDKVDFDKVHVLHAWGTFNEPGIYSKAAEHLQADIYTYKQAVGAYGSSNAFSGICNELLNSMNVKGIDSIPMYDYILIDEAQDLPPSFFRLSYKLIKNNEKRIVYAYDELQNLSKSSMPSLKEMFGEDENGQPLVTVRNSDIPSTPRTDIILPICYRNSKWTLTIAHSLGFGVYRNAKQPLVQFFKELEVWREIGYEVVDGNLNFNSFVRLKRQPQASPEYFDRLMTANEAVVVPDAFNSKEEEYMWVAREIKKNITEDELDPDDILVIFPETKSSYNSYEKFEKYLRMAGIESIMPGKNVDRDTFTVKGKITCTHIHRAKGNERPMVYLVDGEYGGRTTDLINVRNTLFTAITRSRAWIKITGTGPSMLDLIEEINKCIANEYTLGIDIPSREDIEKINLLNRDTNEEEIRKLTNAGKVVNDLLKLLQEGSILPEDLPPEFRELYRFLDNSGE